MSRGIDPSCQAANHRQAGPRYSGCQSLGLSQSVARRVPRSDDRQRQLILRMRLAAPEENTGRIRDLPEQPRVAGIGFDQDRHVMLLANADFAIDIQFLFGRPDATAELRSYAGHPPQLVRGGSQHGRRVSEMIQ
jgi:hypothetical protein